MKYFFRTFSNVFIYIFGSLILMLGFATMITHKFPPPIKDLVHQLKTIQNSGGPSPQETEKYLASLDIMAQGNGPMLEEPPADPNRQLRNEINQLRLDLQIVKSKLIRNEFEIEALKKQIK